MTARQIQQWQQLTGQSQHTLRYMRLTTDLNQPSIVQSRTSSERGIKWASRYFDYPVTQLLDLRPGGPVTSQAPFIGEPPPNLLLGYFYSAKALNNYLFDQRTFSNISYDLYLSPISFERKMTWQILTDCSYSIDTGSYSRAIESSQDLTNTINQIQNAVLMDRILSSLQSGDMQGFGQAINQQNERRSYNLEVNHLPFSQSFRVSGAENRDAQILNTICKIKKALCNFLVLSKNENAENILNLPFSNFWLSSFIEEFSKLELPRNDYNISLKDLATVLTLGKGGLKGGALTLRSGTRVGLPFILRGRENRRAVTESMRRQRGQSIRRFVDRLPVRTRTRPTEALESETEGVPEVFSEMEDETESDREFPETSGLSRSRFNDEVIATIVDLIQTLEDELTPEARRSDFFDYGRDFFELLIGYYNRNELSEELIHKWLMYFFIIEHIASTLYYLHAHFVQNRLANRNIGIRFAQVILRGRNNQGEEIFTRVWFNRESRALKTLYKRIVKDIIGIIDAAGKDINFTSPEERDQLLQEIQFVENSGTVDEILSQINTPFTELDSVDLAFRLKLSGIVAYSTNPIVLRSFERARQAALARWLQRP
ncbi:pTP [Bovine atadenovirus D]|uniref:PTP n=1 Tax=Bovine adenovirus 4 TaxID=70333 RepID=Q997I3_ADEB4|nr:pTP [Bovine atadenovirus D]AAK13184.1 pTP [Bovine adenovirus 4]